MKRIITLLLTALFAAAALAACNESQVTPTVSTTAAATENASEAPTIAPTEAPTAAATEAPTQAPTEKPAALDTSFTYTDPAGMYELTVPVIWNATGLILEDKDANGNETARFVYKDAYYQGAGHVFTVVMSDSPSRFVDVSMFPRADELYNDGSVQIYAIYPTDVQWAIHDKPGTEEYERQQSEYKALSDTREAIIASFRKL